MISKRNLYAVGFFLFMEFLVIIKNTATNDYYAFLWFCDFVPLLFAIFFYFENDQMIKGLINIGFLPQLAFFAVLCSALLFGIGKENVADVLTTAKVYLFITFLLHLISVNVALFLTYKVKPRQKSLLYSFMVLVVMLAMGLLLAPENLNANYIHYFDFLGFNLNYNIYLWLILVNIIVVIPTYLIQAYFYSLSQRRGKKGFYNYSRRVNT